MSCLPFPPPTKIKQPEFEPVTFVSSSTPTPAPRPHAYTYAHRRLAANLGAAATETLPTATSSPKLRLDLSHAGLMSEDDFEGILGREKLDLDKERRELRERMKRLGLRGNGDRDGDGNEGEDEVDVYASANMSAHGSAVSTTAFFDGSLGSDTTGAGVESEVKKKEEEEGGGKVEIRRGPRPLSFMPRVGTLTALPGARMADACDGGDGDGFPDSSKIVSTPITSKSMTPPPSLPASTSTRPVNICVPPSTPVETAVPTRRMRSLRIGQSHGKKRKLSLSAPFLDNVKRIFTSGDSKPQITHLTHDATAVNREASVATAKDVEDIGVSNDHNSNNDSGSGDASDPITPVTARTEIDTNLPRLTNRSSPSRVTSKNLNQGRNLATPIFTGPSSVYSTTGDPDPSTPTPLSSIRSPIPRLLSTIQKRMHQRTNTNTSTISTVTESNTANISNATSASKAALNQLIVKLRSQISDLTLENRVLKDQIAIVRKDWIDTAQELDVERHRSWEGEMMRFRLGVSIEELRAEVGRLRRGSVID